MLYEPDNGLSWWRYQTSAPDAPGGILERFRLSSIPYLTSEKIVCFISEGADLWVRDSNEHASSMDDAVNVVLSTLQTSQETILAGGMEWFTFVSLVDIVRAGLLDPQEMPLPAFPLTSVSWDGKQWQVGMKDQTGNAVTLYLNKDYELVGVKAVASHASL